MQKLNSHITDLTGTPVEAVFVKRTVVSISSAARWCPRSMIHRAIEPLTPTYKAYLVLPLFPSCLNSPLSFQVHIAPSAGVRELMCHNPQSRALSPRSLLCQCRKSRQGRFLSKYWPQLLIRERFINQRYIGTS
jgi:hypothetical protein